MLASSKILSNYVLGSKKGRLSLPASFAGQMHHTRTGQGDCGCSREGTGWLSRLCAGPILLLYGYQADQANHVSVQELQLPTGRLSSGLSEGQALQRPWQEYSGELLHVSTDGEMSHLRLCLTEVSKACVPQES